MSRRKSSRKGFMELHFQNPEDLQAPSARNRRIFTLVRVDNQPQRAVAKRFQISPQRVSDILETVEQWIGCTAGDERPVDWVEKLRVREFVHRERLDSLYAWCLEGRDRSFRDLKTTKTVYVGKVEQRREETVREQAGNARWCDLAQKVAQARIEFEREVRECEASQPEQGTDGQRVAQLEREISETLFLDRPPEEGELTDVRGLREELQEQQRALTHEQLALQGEQALLKRQREEFEAARTAAKEERDRALAEGRAEGSTTPTISRPARRKQTRAEKYVTPTRSATDIELATQPGLFIHWHYAEKSDFNWVTRRQKTEERIREASERGEMLMIYSGPPFEVKPGVFVIAEPHQPEGRERAAFVAEWRRREAEANEAGWPW